MIYRHSSRHWKILCLENILPISSTKNENRNISPSIPLRFAKDFTEEGSHLRTKGRFYQLVNRAKSRRGAELDKQAEKKDKMKKEDRISGQEEHRKMKTEIAKF
ncbi:unnamed protein product [Moneuplotes crassus]|uniref:Uncharacterized protein n=1 Tax=Euplotes crassus TaxID=5936 RepID=A0AAD1UFK0_EUPCR|nr:unnamed protein product [Moneuplotes crassus]